MRVICLSEGFSAESQNEGRPSKSLRIFLHLQERQSGVAFGEDVSISSPSNRSQREGQLRTPPVDKPVNQSGFGGWVDEKIDVLREAAPLLLAQRP
jgi:hypothetical protein